MRFWREVLAYTLLFLFLWGFLGFGLVYKPGRIWFNLAVVAITSVALAVLAAWLTRNDES